MESIDKNDVDIDKLFEWGTKITIYDRLGNSLIDAYIKLVGDAELNRARIYALRESAMLRKKLKNLDSDERIAYIPDIDSVTKEKIIEAIILMTVKGVAEVAVDKVRIPIPKEPSSEATLEELEKYQKEVDEYPIKRRQIIEETIEKEVEAKRKKLNKVRRKEDLYAEYEGLLINQYCEAEMIGKLKEMCAYLGSFRDENYQTRLFSSLEKFNNVPEEIKIQLIEAYRGLEIGGENLKKLLEVTP